MDRNITTTSYNLLNLPDTIQFKNGNQICNSYLVDGRKVKTVYKTYFTDIVVPQDQIYHGNEPYGLLTNEWSENYVYRDDGNLTLGDMGLYMILNSEGFVSLDYPTTWDNQVYTHNYYVRDHQGNVCLTYKVDGFEVPIQSLLYYPSGGLIYPEEDISFQPYMFGEKEYINMHGLRQYDFGGRYYDPMLVSTPTMDPMCESYYDVSPYSFLGNNPVNTIDPDGRDWYRNNTNGSYYWQEGHGDLNGYTNVGSSISIQLGKNTYFNAYQNAGVVANQAVNTFDLIASSAELQNQFLGKNSPLSENSKSELFNGLVNRETSEIGQTAGQAITSILAGEISGALVGRAASWGIGRITGKILSNTVKTRKIAKAVNIAKQWLGTDAKVIQNSKGDYFFISKDGLRKMRFDLNSPHGDAPHVHLQVLKNGKWRDAIPDTHRIYPK